MYLVPVFYQKYSCKAKYTAGYPVSGFWISRISGFWISRISGWPVIRQKQYPVHPYQICKKKLLKVGICKDSITRSKSMGQR
jgi:hypothetical protein